METQVKKNDLLEVTIEDIGNDGEGIGKYKGYTLFIKDTVVGDRVLVKVIKTMKNYGYGRLMELIQPSSFRVTPRCPIAASCGGCQLQHMTYEKQLEYKGNKVLNCLTRIGGFENVPMEAICGMEEPFITETNRNFLWEEKRWKYCHWILCRQNPFDYRYPALLYRRQRKCRNT